MLDSRKQLNTMQVQGQDTKVGVSPPLEVFEPWLDSHRQPDLVLPTALLWMGGWTGDPRGAPAPPRDGTNCPLLIARPDTATCSVVPDALLQTAGDPLSNPMGPGDRDRWEGDCVTPPNPLCNASLVRHTYEILT